MCAPWGRECLGTRLSGGEASVALWRALVQTARSEQRTRTLAVRARRPGGEGQELRQRGDPSTVLCSDSARSRALDLNPTLLSAYASSPVQVLTSDSLSGPGGV